jgi:hypothetical protein
MQEKSVNQHINSECRRNGCKNYFGGAFWYKVYQGRASKHARQTTNDEQRE